MKRAVIIRSEAEQISTIEDLTSVFESIASLKIAKIRHRVVASKLFFEELWQTYRQLRLDPTERLKVRNTKRSALVVVTGEGKLSGEIDDMVIETFLEAYAKANWDETDMIVVGSHGQAKFKEHGIKPNYSFALPGNDDHIDVSNIIEQLREYAKVTVFYQTYVSLRTQKVATIDLTTAVMELGDEVGSEDEEIVSTKNYIFEPSIKEIADYLESLMLGVALTQVIMESKLAQYASRFNAMNAAKRRAHEMSTGLKSSYHRARRSEADERLKEAMKVIVNGGVA